MMVEALAGMPGGLDVDWPEEYRFETREAEPQPRVRIGAAEGDPRKHPKLRVRTSFLYGGSETEAVDTKMAVVDFPGRVRFIRNFEHESRFLDSLGDLGAEVPSDLMVRRGLFFPTDREVHPRHLTGFVDRLLSLGVRVEAQGRTFRTGGAPKLRVRSGKDWFDLEGGVDFEGRVAPLPEILRAARERRRWVELGDGTVGLLPEEWVARHAWMLPLGETKKDAIRFASSQAVLLDALLAAREAEARESGVGGAESDESEAGAAPAATKVAGAEGEEPEGEAAVEAAAEADEEPEAEASGEADEEEASDEDEGEEEEEEK